MSSTGEWKQAICPHCGTEFKRGRMLCPQCPEGELCMCDVDGPDSFSCELVFGHEGDCRSPYDDQWRAVRPHMQYRAGLR